MLNGQVRALFVTTDGTEITNDMYEIACTWAGDYHRVCGYARHGCPEGSRVDLYAAHVDSEGVTYRTDFIATVATR